jgi:hypothetical protein
MGSRPSGFRLRAVPYLLGVPLGIFRSACDIAGVHCTRASRKQVGVYSKATAVATVARLDEFVGPKA